MDIEPGYTVRYRHTDKEWESLGWHLFPAKDELDALGQFSEMFEIVQDEN